MKKYLQIGLSVSFLIGLLTLVACKDDDAPPTPSELSFAVSSMTVNEADGEIEIEIVLDKPALEDFTVEYELDGTAQDEETETNETPAADYYIIEDDNDYGEVDFEKGQSVGIIRIQLYSDFQRENDETIEIEITDVDSDLVDITRDDDIEITIEQEDGIGIELNWNDVAADLDLIVRIGENIAEWDGIVTVSYFNKPEFVFLPKALENAAFGLSYTYYSASETDPTDPLDFNVIFGEFIDGSYEPEANWSTYEEQYTLVNINKWTEEEDGVLTTQVVQTFEIVDGEWTNFSEITVPPNGSRIGVQDLSTTPIQFNGIKGLKNLLRE